MISKDKWFHTGPSEPSGFGGRGRGADFADQLNLSQTGGGGGGETILLARPLAPDFQTFLRPLQNKLHLSLRRIRIALVRDESSWNLFSK
jgi:hypothetical protein